MTVLLQRVSPGPGGGYNLVVPPSAKFATYWRMGPSPNAEFFPYSWARPLTGGKDPKTTEISWLLTVSVAQFLTDGGKDHGQQGKTADRRQRPQNKYGFCAMSCL